MKFFFKPNSTNTIQITVEKSDEQWNFNIEDLRFLCDRDNYENMVSRWGNDKTRETCSRTSKVFTNLPLLYDDYKPFGVTRFCNTCKKCAVTCPSKSISHDDPTIAGPSMSNHSGVVKWYINPEKCFLFWVKNWMDCNTFVSVCPFNKPAGILHDLVRFLIKRFPILNNLMVHMDGLLGYGKPVKNKNFWESP